MTVPQSASGPASVEADAGRRRRELLSFTFLAVVLAPIISVAFVGSYGLVIWVYQMFNGPPGPGH
ncbi:periplasmic nitrate reductase, NapE protein [Dongia sp.]|uniref:periplasmic nitrate reductase, NapE protein n=1 Tax=Dongia sp. TaxID=1977262 RepID=UPI0035B1BA9F